MAWRNQALKLRKCTECDATFEPYNEKDLVCDRRKVDGVMVMGPCARARKTRLQKERRDAARLAPIIEAKRARWREQKRRQRAAQ
jgi:hypothetical protein